MNMPTPTDLVTRLADQIHTTLRDAFDPDQPLAIVDFPDIKNCGDSAIWLGEIAWLKKRFGKIPSYVCRSRDLEADVLRVRVGDGPIFIHGGGNFGDIWDGKQTFKESIIETFKERMIVQFPQSIHYSSMERADQTARILEQHGNFKLFVRDVPSFEFATSKFQCEVILCPDMAFCIGSLPDRPPLLDTLAMLRKDKEKGNIGQWSYDDIPREDWITEDARAVKLAKLSGAISAGFAPRPHRRFKILDAAANQRFERGIAQISRAKSIVTDRLHVHICSMLLGRPHAVLDNNYGKIARHMDAFYPDGTGLTYRATSLTDAVDWARAQAETP